MKLLVVIAVCVMSTMAMPRNELLKALKRVLEDDEPTTSSPLEIDPEIPAGIEGVRMLDWTVMEMLEEGCLRRLERGPPPPPMTTEAPEETPERKLLNALKRMVGDGPNSPHPRANRLMRALDQLCGALMERLDGEEGGEGTDVDMNTEQP
ncbi:hypothetical protein LOTGIDRAFT_236351 [Lottia gigantea]|uniref:Uncharacterized protein n=1 Tax=Lottia gigantea TaxID=225164 RepID=V4B773_LOTGI|nr:hypothetical protein LOTGIDRAFT_236351 [Lottia gigantea]ESO84404.1 hypothetical protein LOTGIDRAFT_236351 [Lottia gigantea]